MAKSQPHRQCWARMDMVPREPGEGHFVQPEYGFREGFREEGAMQEVGKNLVSHTIASKQTQVFKRQR